MLDRNAQRGAIEFVVGEREMRIAIQILDPPFVEKRVLRQFTRAEADSHHPRISNFWRQVAHPTRHQVEYGATYWQDLTIEIGDHRNGGAIDMHRGRWPAEQVGELINRSHCDVRKD